MQALINSYVLEQNHIHPIKIFGRARAGVPGVELIGVGSLGRLIREKILFFTKSYHPKVKLKQYILCIDEIPLRRKLEKQDLAPLEVPLLILFWQLAGILQIGQLQNCVASGQLNFDGSFQVNTPSFEEICSLQKQLKQKVVVMTDQNVGVPFTIELRQLLGLKEAMVLANVSSQCV